MTKRKINQKIYFNPITKIVSESINESKKEFFIAVPFISSFAKSILNEERLSKIKSKKLLTCFNEFNLNSFDLDTLSFLLANGVEIRFNNEIALGICTLWNGLLCVSGSLCDCESFCFRTEYVSPNYVRACV